MIIVSYCPDCGQHGKPLTTLENATKLANTHNASCGLKKLHDRKLRK